MLCNIMSLLMNNCPNRTLKVTWIRSCPAEVNHLNITLTLMTKVKWMRTTFPPTPVWLRLMS